jgi:hypothetical protein
MSKPVHSPKIVLNEQQIAALITQTFLRPSIDDRPNAACSTPEGDWLNWSAALPLTVQSGH